MKNKSDHIYQFKITLNGVSPPIWRRIQVPGTFTFLKLHNAIQKVMGWHDSHLHQFSIIDPSTGEQLEIGIPENDPEWQGEILHENKQKIANFITIENSKARYIYDFGDNWDHIIVLEKILPIDKNVKYPVCIAGKRACPPEDCGGVWGYEELLQIISDPDHEEYEEMKEWLGDEFDPEHFDVKEVQFF